MDFTDVIRRQRMCREYLDRAIEPEKVNALLDAATRFPSAGHTQPQEFVVVEDAAIKQALGEAALQQMFIADAPLVIVVVSDTERSAARYGRRGVDFYSVIDGAFAAMLILLAAVDQGLGAAFVGAFHDDKVARVLHLPEHVRPIGAIALGYCAEPPERHPRRPRHELFHQDTW